MGLGRLGLGVYSRWCWGLIGIWDGCGEYYIKAGIFHEDRGYGAVFIRFRDCERAFLGGYLHDAVWWSQLWPWSFMKQLYA
jgi:hypothetical protein